MHHKYIPSQATRSILAMPLGYLYISFIIIIGIIITIFIYVSVSPSGRVAAGPAGGWVGRYYLISTRSMVGLIVPLPPQIYLV